MLEGLHFGTKLDMLVAIYAHAREAYRIYGGTLLHEMCSHLLCIGIKQENFGSWQGAGVELGHKIPLCLTGYICCGGRFSLL